MAKLFISSVQKELSHVRRSIANYLREDPLLGSYFEPFLFEEVPATTASPGAVYLEEVKSPFPMVLKCAFGGRENKLPLMSPGMSPGKYS